MRQYDRPSLVSRYSQHPVQDRHADGSLGLLGGETAGAQPRSDQRFVTAHCRFNQRGLTVAGGCLPGQPPMVRDHFQVAIPLCGRTGFAPGTAVERSGITTSMSSPCAAIVR
jgi:hypothetical protein